MNDFCNKDVTLTAVLYDATNRKNAIYCKKRQKLENKP